MNKYSFIAIVIAILIGAGAGHLFTSSTKNKELLKVVEQHKKELLKQNEESKLVIEASEQRLILLEEIAKKDSLIILNLEYRIKQDGVVVNQLRKERQKLSTDEKIDFLTKRYSN